MQTVYLSLSFIKGPHLFFITMVQYCLTEEERYFLLAAFMHKTATFLKIVNPTLSCQCGC